MKDVVILGAGGHAHVIADIIEAAGDRVAAFLDDDPSAADCVGSISDYIRFPNCEFIIGIGNADIREQLSSLPLKWYTAVHPSAVISPSVNVGEGTVIMPNAVINARTIIGRHCIVNTAAIVEHDNRIGNFAHISVGATLGGTVTVGESSWIGIGAVISHNISVCADSVIGAGAVVVSSIDVPGTYIGIPAKAKK